MSYHGPERRSKEIEVQELKAEIDLLKDEISDIKESVEGLLTLWRDGIGAVRIIKMLAWLAGSIAAIYAGMNIWGKG